MTAENAGRDLALLAAMVEQLDSFLTRREVTRRLVFEWRGRRLAATMSLGILLNLTARLRDLAPSLPADQQERLQGLLRQVEKLRELRAEDYAAALRREVKSHLDSWSWYLESLSRGEQAAIDDYGSEVWIRTRLAQLLDEAQRIGLEVQAEARRLADCDRRLRDLVEPRPETGADGAMDADTNADSWWLQAAPRSGLAD